MNVFKRYSVLMILENNEAWQVKQVQRMVKAWGVERLASKNRCLGLQGQVQLWNGSWGKVYEWALTSWKTWIEVLTHCRVFSNSAIDMGWRHYDWLKKDMYWPKLDTKASLAVRFTSWLNLKCPIKRKNIWCCNYGGSLWCRAWRSREIRNPDVCALWLVEILKFEGCK